MENAMFERLELQSDDILQAYYMRSQFLLLLEYAGTLEETLGFSGIYGKKRRSVAVFLQQDECRSRSRSA